MVFQKDTRVFNMTNHFVNTGGWNLTEMNILAIAMKNWWTDSLRSLLSNQVSLTQVQCRVYNPENPLALDYAVSPPTPGVAAGPPASGNVTGTISWRTGLAGRKFRGRNYIPGFLEVLINDDDTIQSGLVASLATAAIYFLGGWQGTGIFPCVFHRATNTYTPITSYVTENLVDSMRRRLPGRGR